MSSNKKTPSLFDSKSAKSLWDKADDGIHTSRMLSEIYDEVPEDLDVPVEVFELHRFQCPVKTKKLIIKWLNKD